MLRKKITILIAVILCCAALFSCSAERDVPNYSKDVIVPSKSDKVQPSNNINIDEINGNYIISDIDNIVKLDEDEYSGLELKKLLEDPADPIIVYLSENQLEKIKKTYSEDLYSTYNFTDEEIIERISLGRLDSSIAFNNGYYGGITEIDLALKHTSDKKIIGDYSYVYYILDLDYYGSVVFYAIFKKNNSEEWEYASTWAYTKNKKNISLEYFLKKEIIYNNYEDDMKYFGCYFPSNIYPGANFYLDNGQTGSINYMPIYTYDENDISYEICYRIALGKFSLFDILQEGDKPEEVLKKFKG